MECGILRAAMIRRTFLHGTIVYGAATMLGAFRTPSLRNLKNKHAYFHDGSKSTLYQVVDFYDHGVMPLAPHVSPVLKNGADVRFLVLNKQEKMSLVVYLRSMEGQPIDAVLTSR